MKIITYATHSSGTFDTISQNEHVVVLGYGDKWEGFLQRAKVINEYLNTLPDDEIVVVIDGFDSYIKKHDSTVIEKFLSMDCGVLISVVKGCEILSYFPDWFATYFTEKVYGKGKVANNGLMMGRVEYLKILFGEVIPNGPSNEDQRNLNMVKHKLSFLKMDVFQAVFDNCSSVEEVENSTACYCQIPGKASFSRLIRGLYEYLPFFKYEIIIFTLFFLVTWQLLYQIKIRVYSKWQNLNLQSH